MVIMCQSMEPVRDVTCHVKSVLDLVLATAHHVFLDCELILIVIITMLPTHFFL